MDVMESYAAGAKAVVSAEQSKQDYQSLIGSKEDLKSAYEQSSVDPETGTKIPADSFKVNSLAARMAASRGDLKSFEVFNKQAQTFKKDELVNQMKELEIQDNKIETAERTLQMMTNPGDALKEIMKADNPLPMAQKMQIVKDLKELGDDPVKFKKWQEDHLMKILPAKEAIAAKRAQMKLAFDIQDKEEDNKRQLTRDQETARHNAALESKVGKSSGISNEDKYRKDDIKTQNDMYAAEENYNKQVARIEAKTNLNPSAKAAELKAAKDSFKQRMNVLKGRLHEQEPEPEKPKAFDKAELANVPAETKQELLAAIKADGKVAEESFDQYHGIGAARAIVDEDRSKPKKSWLDTILGGGGPTAPKGNISSLPRATPEQIAQSTKNREKAGEESKARIAEKKKQLQEEAAKEDAQKAKQQKEEEVAFAKRKLEVLERQLEAAKQKKEPDSIKIKGLMKQISFVKQQINQ
jgi:hypothetical protein